MKAGFNELSKVSGAREQALPRSGATQVGTRHGQSITLLESAQDVDEQILSERYRSAMGLSSNIERLALHQRKISTELTSKSFNLDQIRSYGKSTGTSERIGSKAQEILKKLLQNQKPPQAEPNVSGLMQHYMSLQLLSRALSGNDSQYTSLLTPQGEISDDLNELARSLQDAGDDAEKISALLRGISGLPTKEDEHEQLKKLMESLRFQPDELESKLKTAQRLPDIDKSTKEKLKEKVNDAIHDLENQHATTLRGAINSLGAALQTGDVERFHEGYNDVISETSSFSDVFSKLLNHYTLSELITILPRMKQALAEDLASDKQSTEKVKLESLLTELSYMHISSTLIEMVEKLASSHARIYGNTGAMKQDIDQQKLLISITKIISGGWISSSQFERLAAEHNIPEGAQSIYFLNGIKKILRDLPFKVTLDIESRNALIEAAQNAIEAAIEKEESAIYGWEQ